MLYDAITIDSNVAIQAGIKLESGLLAQLFQFKDGPVDFLISDVVFGEISKHLNKNTKKARDAAISAIRGAIDLGLIEADTAAMLTDAMPDSRDIAKSRLQGFLIATGAKVVHSSAIPSDQVMKLYFQAKPPFDENGPKKDEFPDAIALLSLEKWAKDSGKKILAVSGDKGWHAFAEDNDHIDVVESLGVALATLQNHTEKAVSVVSAMLRSIVSGGTPENNALLLGMLESSVVDFEVRADAESYYFFEADSVEIELIDFEIPEYDGAYDIKIVRMSKDEVVAQVSVQLTINALADFSLSIKDGIDRDYVSIGGASASQEAEVESEMLLTIWGDLDGPVENIQIGDAQVLREVLNINFGTLDLDHDDDDYQEWLDQDLGEDIASSIDEDGKNLGS